jgi:hypothetical protein
MIYLRIFSIFLTFFLISCSSVPVDPVTGEQKTYELDEKKRIRDNIEKGGGIFGDIGKSSKETTFSFGTSNVSSS